MSYMIIQMFSNFVSFILSAYPIQRKTYNSKTWQHPEQCLRVSKIAPRWQFSGWIWDVHQIWQFNWWKFMWAGSLNATSGSRTHGKLQFNIRPSQTRAFSKPKQGWELTASEITTFFLKSFRLERSRYMQNVWGKAIPDCEKHTGYVSSKFTDHTYSRRNRIEFSWLFLRKIYGRLPTVCAIFMCQNQSKCHPFSYSRCH